MTRFYGFANTTGASESIITSPPPYMLVELKPTGDDKPVQIAGLPEGIVPLESVQFKYSAGHGRYVKLQRFPITLAYAITGSSFSSFSSIVGLAVIFFGASGILRLGGMTFFRGLLVIIVDDLNALRASSSASIWSLHPSLPSVDVDAIYDLPLDPIR
jgi:hypothetical protein